jgi:hypothetical protein
MATRMPIEAARSLNDKRENPARCGDALFFRDGFPPKRVPNYRRAPKCSRVLEEAAGLELRS